MDIPNNFVPPNAVPPTVPPTPNQVPMDNIVITPHTKSSSGALKFFVILLVLVLLGGTAFASYKYFFSAKYSPESAVQNMVGELVKVKSLAYKASIDYSATANPSTEGFSFPGGTIKIGLDGATDWHDTGNILSKNDVSVDYSDPEGAMSIGGAINTLVVAKTLYLKLAKAPDLGFFDLSALKDQWIKAEAKDAENSGLTYTAKFTDYSKNANQVKAILEQASVFKITDKLGKEKIGEVETYHLKLAVDKKELKSLVRKLNELAPADEKATPEELAEADKMIDDFKMDEFEIWVGINDALPYRLTSETKDLDIEGVKISGKTNVELSNYNQPLTLTAPTDAKTFEEVMNLMMGTDASSTATSSMSSGF